MRPVGCMSNLDRWDFLGAVLLISVFLLVAAAPFGAKPFGDVEFHAQAKKLSLALKGADAAEVRFIRGASGPILYYVPPYIFVPARSPDHRYWLAAVTWTAGWMVVALWLLRRVADRIGGERAGLFAMFLVLASPFSVYYSLGILAEGPAYISTVLFLFGWAEASARGGDARRWPRVLMVFGLLFLILCRPNAGLILGLGTAAWFVLRKRDRSAARLTASAVAWTMALFVGVSLLLSALPRPTKLAGRSGFRFELFDAALVGRFQYRTEPWDWRFWDSQTRQGSADHAGYSAKYDELIEQSRTTGARLDDVLTRWVLHDTFAHPMTTAKMVLVRVISMHVALVNSKPPAAFAIGPISGPIVYWTFHGAANAIGLSIAGLALTFLWRRRGSVASLWPLWGPWLALVLFHAVVYAEPRYLLPAKAAQVVMASCVLAELIRRAPVIAVTSSLSH